MRSVSDGPLAMRLGTVNGADLVAPTCLKPTGSITAEVVKLNRTFFID